VGVDEPISVLISFYRSISQFHENSIPILSSKVVIYEYRQQLPLSLRNRRRIWRLLEEAKVGDIAQLRIRERAAGEERERERERNVQPMLPKLLPGPVIRII